MNPEAGRSYPGAFVGIMLLLGSIVIGITLLGLGVITAAELADPGHFLAVAFDPAVASALWITFSAATVAVLLLGLVGTSLAYVLARSRNRFAGIAESLVDLPLVLPHTVAGLLVYLIFFSRGPIGSPAAGIGLLFEDAFPGIVAAMFFVASPFYINSVREGFEKVPPHLENVARTLGASPLQVFLHVTLPLSTRQIASGAALAWGRAVGEFAAVVIIAYFPMVISTLIYSRFTTGGLAEARSIAFVMILLCLCGFFTYRALIRFGGKRHDRV
ncbi:MAG: ABC transporter permease [Methanomicrobiales archaeon]|nr:ABC transporter permease [Methanomicrobiales archaeon]